MLQEVVANHTPCLGKGGVGTRSIGEGRASHTIDTLGEWWNPNASRERKHVRGEGDSQSGLAGTVHKEQGYTL